MDITASISKSKCEYLQLKSTVSTLCPTSLDKPGLLLHMYHITCMCSGSHRYDALCVFCDQLRVQKHSKNPFLGFLNTVCRTWGMYVRWPTATLLYCCWEPSWLLSVLEKASSSKLSLLYMYIFPLYFFLSFKYNRWQLNYQLYIQYKMRKR